jgi:glutathione S-transferase
MELYGHPFSPYAFKVRAALYEKGIAHEKREIRTHADREGLLRVNPRGEVPALADEGAVLCDSKGICAYLEERNPTPALYPSDLALRAVATSSSGPTMRSTRACSCSRSSSSRGRS